MSLVTLPDCRVIGVGPDETAGVVSILLKIQSFEVPGVTGKEIWFSANQQLKQEMLETALTALTTGFQVEATVNGPVDSSWQNGETHGPIEILHIIRT